MSPTPPLAGRPAYALAALSGLLYFLAFPGVDLWPLAFVALVPLRLALRGQTPRRAAGLGWLAGFVMTMTGFYWLLEMLRTFSGFGTALCLLFMALLCGYQAGRIALFGWLYARAERRGWPQELMFALAFVASEQLYPLLFPWTYAATVHQVPVLLQLAELVGPSGPTLLLVTLNLAVAELLAARWERRRPRRRLLGVATVSLGLALSFGALRMHQLDGRVAAAPKAEVGLVQANMSLLGKRKNKDEGLRRHLEATARLKAEGPLDLVVWSETSAMRAVDVRDVPVAVPLQITRHLGVPTVLGAVLYEDVADEREYVLYNSALLSDAQGTVVGRYDKQFLLAFGEYLPLGDRFPMLYRWSPNSGKFTPGSSLLPLKLGEHELATFICYEDISAAFVRSIVRNGSPDLLVNITNDAWFGDTTEPWIHLALSKLRAIEQRRFFVRSTNSGVSAVMDPVGRVVTQSHPFQEETLRATVAWLRPTTLYGALGDAPVWLLCLVQAALAFFPRRRALEPT